MKPIPAIDIRGGKVVRLLRGDAGKETVYTDSPLEVAWRWSAYEIDMIHVVDLDGAFRGEMVNFDVIKEIAETIRARLELGGGIRDQQTIRKALDVGIARVVVGTRALDKSFFAGLDKDTLKKVAIGIDAKDGFVCTNGWVTKTGTRALDFAREIEDLGVGTVIYTDISKDGALEGPNIKGLQEILKNTKINVVASGGVSNIDDIRNLKALNEPRLEGVIIGKALYERTLDLGEAVEVCKE